MRFSRRAVLTTKRAPLLDLDSVLPSSQFVSGIGQHIYARKASDKVEGCAGGHGGQ